MTSSQCVELMRQKLFSLSDKKNKDFLQKLIPTLDPDLILGVRVPQLRKLAKELANTKEAEAFLEILPHNLFEENNLHGCLIENNKDFEETLERTETFLPFIDNWATCDIFAPKVFKKYPKQVYDHIKQWINEEHVYTVRYGIGMLLSNYLDSEFSPEMLELVADIDSDEYYVNMMRAWYFSTALVKQYQATLPYIAQKSLDPWTHNKAIQKATESRRIAVDIKTYLRSLKV